MPHLSLTLLGSLAITLDDRPVTHLESDKVRALLVRLALEPERIFRREALSALFWPEAAPAHAAQNLRQALYNLRCALGDAFLLATSQTVQFNAAGDVEVDVLTWQRLWAEVQNHRHRHRQTCRYCLERLAQAVTLYRGDLLAGFTLKGCPEFDDWITIERERLHVQALEAFTLLAQAAERRGDYPAAQAYIRQQLALEPWQEAAHRHLMRLLASDGWRVAALEQFEICRRILAEELGLAPTEETRALYEQIRTGAPLPTGTTLPSVLVPDLPAQLTSFIGRETELALLAERLSDPAYRLITLTGPGGIGKTRLALQAAAAQADQFADGVCWLPLADTEDATDVALAIAHALGFKFSGAQDIWSQLLHALHNERRELLLVLDNFEHLLPLGGAELVLRLLRTAPRITLLITSRERLNLQAESVLSLQGLGCEELTDGVSLSEAAQLFAERAGRARMGFTLTAGQSPAVVEICRLLEGSPLGIELAATWVGDMPLERIADAIKSTLDFLASTSPDLPARHRSLRAVFDQAWSLLSAEERSALMQVAVFRGGFGAEAAQQVAGVSAPTLASLSRKSLLAPEASLARYRLHADIRYYAAEKLEAQQHAAQVRARHATFFADFVRQRESVLRGSQQNQAQAEIEQELQNVLAAWQWGLAGGDVALLARLAHGLFVFYESKSWFKEGTRVFQPAIEQMQDAAPADPTAAHLLRQLLARQAVFYRQLSQYDYASGLIEEGLALSGLPSDEDQAFLLYQKAWVAFLQAQYAQAQMWTEASLEIYQAMEHAMGIGDCLYMLGWTAYELGDFAQAEALCREAQAVCEQAGYTWGVQYAIYGLGLVQRARGDYAAAWQSFLRNLTFCEEIGYPWGIAQARINLGLVALTQDDAQTAADCFQKSLVIGERINNLWVVAQSYKGLSEAALKRRDVPAAQTLAQRGLALYQQMQDRDGMADCLLLLSGTAQETGDMAGAWRDLEAAEAYIRASENGFRAARALYRRAQILLQEGASAQARALLEETLRHPACERHIYDRAAAALSTLVLSAI